MRSDIKSFYLLLMVMVVASLVAMYLRPTHLVADEGEKIDLNHMVPLRFSQWESQDISNGQIVNPAVEAQLSKLYSQTLSRVYVNANGARIMLTIAYGAKQTDANNLHYPEVCYPAQGFQIKYADKTILNTKFGEIKAKRLYAVMGSRYEPITYWATVGNKTVWKGLETKIEKLKYGLNGYIPDGMLFRVSTIGLDQEEAYNLQQTFINSILEAMLPKDRMRFSGLSTE